MNRSLSEQLADLFPETRMVQKNPEVALPPTPVFTPRSKPTHGVLDHDLQRIVFEGVWVECRQYVFCSGATRSLSIEKFKLD